MQAYFIVQRNFVNFLKGLSVDYKVYTLQGIDGLYPKGESYLNEKSFLWKKFSADTAEDIVFGEYRPSIPIKSFFFKAYDKVSSYPVSGNDIEKPKPYCLIGVKSCDLKSFITEDSVFLKGNYVDSHYQYYRQNNIIISSDCTNFKSVCYCLHLDITPYPKAGFDLNLSEAGNGFVVEVGSEKGKALIAKRETLFQQARKEHLEMRDKSRAELVKKLKKSIASMQMPPISLWPKLAREKLESQVWNKEAYTCVECGACTQICPTCHCFLLGDQKAAFGYERFKIWDSCQYNGFARVAGGANPRPRRIHRLRNRYVKKFDYFPTIMNEVACTGCGRCIEACPGKIDMRRIFRDLNNT